MKILWERRKKKINQSRVHTSQTVGIGFYQQSDGESELMIQYCLALLGFLPGDRKWKIIAEKKISKQTYELWHRIFITRLDARHILITLVEKKIFAWRLDTNFRWLCFKMWNSLRDFKWGHLIGSLNYQNYSELGTQLIIKIHGNQQQKPHSEL